MRPERKKAEDCLLDLAKLHNVEREQLAGLNDQLVRLIEYQHFLEAQHTAFSHDISSLRGFNKDNVQVKFVYESEVKVLREKIQDTLRDRQHLEAKVNGLLVESEGVKQKWQHSRDTRKGIPPEVDAEIVRLTEIEAENALTQRRTKAMEEQCIIVKRENNRILDEINRYKMRRDQEVVIRHEYHARAQELLANIRNLTASNSTAISVEVNLLRRDPTQDNREYFRRETQRAIDEIRADYEAKTISINQEIKTRLEIEIRRIQESVPQISVTNDLTVIKQTFNDIQQQVYDYEARNIQLRNQLDDLTYQISEDAKVYEALLEEKAAAINKIRARCEELTIDMEKLCERHTDLQAEINEYRRLLDVSPLVYTQPIDPPHRPYVPPPRPNPVQIEPIPRPLVTPPVPVPPIDYPTPIVPAPGPPTPLPSYPLYPPAPGSVDGKKDHIDIVEPRVRPNESFDREHIQKCTRWYTGHIRISEVNSEFVRLENRSSKRSLDVGSFEVIHEINGLAVVSIQIPHGTIISPKQSLKVYARKSDHQGGSIVANLDTFDISTHSKTSLFNSERNIRAWFVYNQQTDQASFE